MVVSNSYSGYNCANECRKKNSEIDSNIADSILPIIWEMFKKNTIFATIAHITITNNKNFAYFVIPIFLILPIMYLRLNIRKKL